MVANEVHSILRDEASRVGALLLSGSREDNRAVEAFQPCCDQVVPIHALHILYQGDEDHAWKMSPLVSLLQRGSFISSHAKIAGSSRCLGIEDLYFGRKVPMESGMATRTRAETTK